MSKQSIIQLAIAYAIWGALWAAIFTTLVLSTEMLARWAFNVNLGHPSVFIVWALIAYFGTQVFSKPLVKRLDGYLLSVPLELTK